MVSKYLTRPYNIKKTDRYYSPYKKEMCDQLIKHMAQGHSFEAFGGIAKVSRETLYNWVKKHKDFAEAKQIGYSAWLNFVETLLISKTTGKELINGVNPKQIDIVGALFMLKTRASAIYFEKKEIGLDADEKITVIVK